MLKPEILKFVQRNLKKRGFYKGKDDGDFGPKSQAALALETRIPPPKKTWDLEQKIIGYIQLLCYDNHINPKGLDGKWGPEHKQPTTSWFLHWNHRKTNRFGDRMK